MWDYILRAATRQLKQALLRSPCTVIGGLARTLYIHTLCIDVRAGLFSTKIVSAWRMTTNQVKTAARVRTWRNGRRRCFWAAWCWRTWASSSAVTMKSLTACLTTWRNAWFMPARPSAWGRTSATTCGTSGANWASRISTQNIRHTFWFIGTYHCLFAHEFYDEGQSAGMRAGSAFVRASMDAPIFCPLISPSCDPLYSPQKIPAGSPFIAVLRQDVFAVGRSPGRGYFPKGVLVWGEYPVYLRSRPVYLRSRRMAFLRPASSAERM